MDRFFPGAGSANSFSQPLTLPLPMDDITSVSTPKKTTAACPSATVDIAAAINELFRSALIEKATGKRLVLDETPRLFHVPTLLASATTSNSGPKPRKSVSFATLDAENNASSQKCRFDTIISKYMVHSVAHPSVAGAQKRAKRSLTAENTASQSLSQVDNPYIPMSQGVLGGDEEDEVESSDDGAASIDLEDLDTAAALRGGADQYDLTDDWIDDSELIAEIEMAEDADSPAKEGQTGEEERAGEWRGYRALTATEMRLLRSGQISFDGIPTSGFSQTADIHLDALKTEVLGASPSAGDDDEEEGEGGEEGGDGAASTQVETPSKRGASKPKKGKAKSADNANSATPVGQQEEGKGGQKTGEKRTKDLNMQRLRRQEEEEQRKKEFIEENINKPWNITQQVQDAFNAYEKAVRSRNARIREVSRAAADAVASTQTVSTELGAIPIAMLDTPVLQMETFDRLAPLLPSGMRDFKAAGTAGEAVPDVNSFPYELDDMLAMLDTAVREANKSTRPAGYIARLMRMRGFPASREGVRLHFLRAAALSDAASARRRMLASIEKLSAHVASQCAAEPDMADANGGDRMTEEMQSQSLLRVYALHSFVDASKRFYIAADCFKRSEEHDAKEATKVDADPAARLRAAFVADFDDFAGALQADVNAADESEGAGELVSTSERSCSDVLLNKAASPVNMQQIFEERGWFHWNDELRGELFDVVAAAFSWVTAENEYRALVKSKQVRDMRMAPASFSLLEPFATLDNLVLPMVLQCFPSGAITPVGVQLQFRIHIASLLAAGATTNPAADAHAVYLRLRSTANNLDVAGDEDDNGGDAAAAPGDGSTSVSAAATDGTNLPNAVEPAVESKRTPVAGVKRKRQSTAATSASTPIATATAPTLASASASTTTAKATGAGRTKGSAKRAIKGNPDAELFDEPLAFRVDKFWPPGAFTASQNDGSGDVALLPSAQLLSSQLLSPTQRGSKLISPS